MNEQSDDPGTSVLKQDYATQYFGFPPKGFADGVYNILFEHIHDAVETLKACLQNKYSDIMTPDEISSACDQLMQELLKDNDSIFDKFEIYVDLNALRIPPNVVLPEDKVHRIRPFTKEQDEELDREIKDLHLDIQAADYAIKLLTQKIEEQKAVETKMKSILAKIAEMDKILDSGGLKEKLELSSDKTKELIEAARKVSEAEKSDEACASTKN